MAFRLRDRSCQDGVSGCRGGRECARPPRRGRGYAVRRAATAARAMAAAVSAGLASSCRVAPVSGLDHASSGASHSTAQPLAQRRAPKRHRGVLGGYAQRSRAPCGPQTTSPRRSDWRSGWGCNPPSQTTKTIPHRQRDSSRTRSTLATYSNRPPRLGQGPARIDMGEQRPVSWSSFAA